MCVCEEKKQSYLYDIYENKRAYMSVFNRQVLQFLHWQLAKELTNGYVYECRSIFINGCILVCCGVVCAEKVTVRPLFDRTNLECIEMSSIGRVVIFYD